MNTEIKKLRVAIICALALSVAAQLAICSLILGPEAAFRFVVIFPCQISAAYCAMLAYAWWAAPRWGKCCVRNCLWAGLFAVSVFALGALAGGITSLIVYWDFAPLDYVVEPVSVLLLYGSLPAFAMGIIGSWLARSLLRRKAEESV